ncbi:hypothetical protein NFI96_002045 [Prochilodus magdalenae]|nr:hypothetical protein NFI96_002045 [Prochilodus magdalenae]
MVNKPPPLLHIRATPFFPRPRTDKMPIKSGSIPLPGSLSPNHIQPVCFAFLNISRRGRHAPLPLHVGGTAVEVVSNYRYLGVHLSNNLTWSNNTSSLVRKAHQRLYFLRRLRRAGLGSSVLTSFYRCVVESVLCSSINVWHGSCSAAERKALQRVVKAAQRTSFSSDNCTVTMWEQYGIYSRTNYTLNSTTSPYNITLEQANATKKPLNIFSGCDNMVEGILFDLIVESFNVIVGLPANILVIAILIRNRHEPTTSDIFLGCLAFMDAYFGVMAPISFLNFYHWKDKKVSMALGFSYGVKDTSGPLFLSCICLDRFMAVLFPITFSRLKASKYRIGLSVFVLCLIFAYASAKAIGGIPNFEKVFTGQILVTFTWMVVCNLSILWALKRSKGAGNDKMHPMKKKAFKMVLSLLAILVCNYLPPVALFPFQDYYPPMVFPCYVQPVGFAFLNMSSSIQPLVYLSRLKKVPFLPQSIVKMLSCKE